MSNITISKTAAGFQIRFPKALVPAFKAAFKSAEWDRDAVAWNVGPRSGKRLEQWAAEAMADAEAAILADEIEAAGEDLARMREALAMVRTATASANETREKLAAIAAEMAAAKSELATAEAEKLAAENAVAKEKAAITECLGKIIDLEKLRAAIATMARTHNPADRTKKAQFEEARQVASAARQALRDAGWICSAVSWAAEANINRPDRDAIRLMPSNAWFMVSRVGEEE